MFQTSGGQIQIKIRATFSHEMNTASLVPAESLYSDVETALSMLPGIYVSGITNNAEQTENRQLTRGILLENHTKVHSFATKANVDAKTRLWAYLLQEIIRVCDTASEGTTTLCVSVFLF